MSVANSGLDHVEQDQTILRVFGTFRSYVEHEDKLISERISRTLLVHGFLLASGVLLLQSRVEAVAKCLGRDKGCWTLATAVGDNVHLLAPEQLATVLLLIDALLPVIALIGVVTTRSAQLGVWAAQEAIGSLCRKWASFQAEQQAHVARLSLPGLIAGGSEPVMKTGDGTSRFLRYLMLLWLMIFFLNVGLAAAWNLPAIWKWPSLPWLI